MHSIATFGALLAVLVSVNAQAGKTGKGKETLPGKKGKGETLAPLNFLLLGDWGSNPSAAVPGDDTVIFDGELVHYLPGGANEDGSNHEQAAIAAQMAIVAKDIGAQFVVTLGDNFYDSGVSGVNDAYWTELYQNIYNDPALNVPWYVTLGNHDYYQANLSGKKPYQKNDKGLIGANYQIEYNHVDPTGRWFCGHNYTMTWPIPDEHGHDSGMTLQVVFVDTVLLAPAEKPAAGLASDESVWGAQTAWLEATLAASTADFLIVVGHYNMYTMVGGDDSVMELYNRVNPLLIKYNVNAWINGHEHSNEHFIVDSIDYITLGHGCDKDDPLETDPAVRKTHNGYEGVKFGKTIGGFGWMKVTPAGFTFGFVDKDGNHMYQATNNVPARKAKGKGGKGKVAKAPSPGDKPKPKGIRA